MSFFFFNDTATTEIYTLSLHDALPISLRGGDRRDSARAADSHERGAKSAKRAESGRRDHPPLPVGPAQWRMISRSEEHTSELQSHLNLVCRLLLEKKKNHHKLPLSQLD